MVLTAKAPLPLCIISIAAFCLVAVNAWAGELALRQIVDTLFKAAPGSHPDFSGKDLSFLDLSGLDFKRAKLAGANLLGANLSGANLSYAGLAGAKLDRAQLKRTNFAHADLSGASLFHAVGSLSFDALDRNEPNFAAANLSSARIMAHLSRSNMRGANLADARLGPPRREMN